MSQKKRDNKFKEFLTRVGFDAYSHIHLYNAHYAYNAYNACYKVKARGGGGVGYDAYWHIHINHIMNA